MDNNELNSCLMLAVNLTTPIDLGCIFENQDLKGTGLELDSHITLLYAQNKEISNKEILDNIRYCLGLDFEKIINLIKENNEFNVLDWFELSSFENDSDYIILKLKDDNILYPWLQRINTSLKNIYGVKSDFSNYTPHVSLAELNPGTASKYLNSEKLKLMLQDTTVDFEDFMISYGITNEPEDRKQLFLTNYKCIDRYFRIRELKNNNSEL